MGTIDAVAGPPEFDVPADESRAISVAELVETGTGTSPAVPHGRPARKPPRSAKGWLLGTFAAVTAIAGGSLWIGPAPIVAPWDDFTLLNGAYRIYQGQAPGANFANPVGPLVYGLAAIGMHIERAPSLAAVTYGQLIFAVLASTLAWLAAARRLPPVYAAAVTILVALLSVAVRPLGYSPWTTTYAMLYNRDGWLLYSILLLLVLIRRPAAAARRAQVTDGVLLGLILGLLCYDKVTFFLAALAATAVGLALRTIPSSARFGLASLAGFLAVGIFMRLAFNLPIAAYIGDVAEAAKVQVASHRADLLAQVIVWTMPVTIVAVLVAVGMVRRVRRGEYGHSIWPLLLAEAFVLASSILISAGNASEKGDLPALVVLPLLVVADPGPRLPSWAGGPARVGTGGPAWGGTGLLARPEPWLLVGVTALLIGTTGPIVGKDLLALGKAVADRSYDANPPAAQRFAAERLHDFVIPADAEWATAYRVAHNIPAMINNGLALLRRDIRPGDSVVTLAYTDPFSMALGLPLSRCGPLWWDLGYDFNQGVHPSGQCAIGTADWVMIPRMVARQGCCQQTVSVMRSLYSQYLAEHYRQFAETPDWILLRRR